MSHDCGREPSLYLLDIRQRQSEWPLYAVFPYPTVQFEPQREKAVSDLLYIGGGVGVLLLFAGYAVLLRRA